MNNTYYVYAYLRKDGTPYYIGKGTGRRAWCKGKGEIGKPTDDRIIIVEDNLTNVGALAIERRLISWYGRKDLKTGTLRNQTSGGDGGIGAQPGNKLSEATKKKISEAHKGVKRNPMSEESKKKLSESLKGKNLGKTRTEEQRLHQSAIKQGRAGTPHTEETKKKISEANKGVKRNPMREETKKKLSAALTGRVRTAEHSTNLSTAIKGRTPGIIERENYLNAMEAGKTTCEYCGKIATKGNYSRWHGINCKTLLTGEKPHE
jgi:hypothetical protein